MSENLDQRRARLRRNSPTVPFFFPDWLLVRELAAHVRRCLESVGNGRLLDIGCGEKPYECYRTAHISEWVGFDVPENPRADVHGYADSLPFAGGSFDTALCTEVLEHVSEPSTAVDELFRVLAPGGHVILTVPQYFPVHEEPYDFFRYTPYGVRHLFEKSGFEIVTLTPMVTGLRVASLAINACFYDLGDRLPGGKTKIARGLFAPLYVVSNSIGYLLAPLLPDPKNAVNVALVAKKPV